MSTNSLTSAEKILAFYKSLAIRERLPEGVKVMNPYADAASFALCEQFYRKYYKDNNPRTLIVGINPGRNGGGVTGVPFTDPIKLEKVCGIPNTLNKRPELSADFIYEMIDAFGGPAAFYSRFYIGAISPLGFTSDGKNLNYYDIKELQTSLHEFIVRSLKQQADLAMNNKVCYCLGEGTNFKFLSKLNQEHHFFETIVPLAHPRFIMQYKRKKVATYVDEYIVKLSSSLTS